MLNASDEPAAALDALYHAANCYFPDAERLGAVQIRPPFVLAQAGGVIGGSGGLDIATESGVTIMTEASVDLGGDGGRYGQCVFDHTRLDGTVDRILFVNGMMYRWDGGTVFTEITPTTVTISRTARIGCRTFANLIIVTDGVNKPWTFNPATLVATPIEYNSAGSAWNAYGPPYIYSGKLIFIVQSVAGVYARTDIAWSEEGQPTLGYFQSAYDNTWTVTQTSAEPLEALAATNSGLYFGRAGSWGAIYGAISTDFKTSATLDSVSTSVGTTTPYSVIVARDAVWFLDSAGKPWRFGVGSAPEAIWKQARDTVFAQLRLGVQGTQVAAGISVYQPDLDLVLMASYASPSNATIAVAFYAFDAGSGSYCGMWDVDNQRLLHTFGIMRDASGNVSLCALCDTTSPGGAPATGGALYRERRLNEMAAGVEWGDPTGGTIAGVSTHQLGVRDVGEWMFDRVHVRARETNTFAPNRYMRLTAYTPTVTSSQIDVPITLPTATSGFPEAFQVPNLFGYDALAQGTAGLDAVGRYIQIVLSPYVSGTITTVPFRPVSVSVDAVDVGGADPLSV